MKKEIERAMKEEQKGTNVKLLSLGVGPLISQEKKDKIEHYEKMHMAHRAIPDRFEQERLSLYLSNVTQSSATSLERARQAMEARRTENADGSARSEVAKRGRRQLTRRKTTKRRRKDVEAELNTANLLKRDGSETFSKFRSCCNASSSIRDSS